MAAITISFSKQTDQFPFPLPRHTLSCISMVACCPFNIHHRWNTDLRWDQLMWSLCSKQKNLGHFWKKTPKYIAAACSSQQTHPLKHNLLSQAQNQPAWASLAQLFLLSHQTLGTPLASTQQQKPAKAKGNAPELESNTSKRKQSKANMLSLASQD